MKKIQVIKFESSDGKVFDNEDEVRKYEIEQLIRANLTFAGRQSDQEKAMERTVKQILENYEKLKTIFTEEP